MAPVRGFHDLVDHPQHRRLAGQHVAANLLVVRDLAPVLPAHRRVDIDRRLHGADPRRLKVNRVYQLPLSRSLQRCVAQLPLHLAGTEQAPGQWHDRQ